MLEESEKGGHTVACSFINHCSYGITSISSTMRCDLQQVSPETI